MGGDVLSPRGDDDVFFPVGDDQESFAVDVPDVPGPEPVAVLEYIRYCFF